MLDENEQILENIEIEIKNIQTKEITTLEVKKGEYISSLTLGDNDDVLLTVKKQGFSFHSTYISHKDGSFESPKNLNIKLESLKNGKSFKIEHIYFDNNSFKMDSSAKEVLLEFSNYLKINQSLIIEINGFTDNIGEENDNQLLSENRAKAVRNLILMQGISEERVFYNGFGESLPVFSNDTENGRAKNRRTEFKIISQ